MSVHFVADHGFKYCAGVKDHRKGGNEASCLEGWYQVVCLVMRIIFLLFLFIML